MKKRILLAAVLALAAVLIQIFPAFATPLDQAIGKLAWAGAPTDMTFRPAGNDCFMKLNLPYRFYDGNLEGFATFKFDIVSHGLCPAMPNQYDENLKARGTFVGTVNGKAGTLELMLVLKGYPGEIGEKGLSGKIVILSGTGDLANLHGVLEVTNLLGNAFDTYAGEIHFEP